MNQSFNITVRDKMPATPKHSSHALPRLKPMHQILLSAGLDMSSARYVKGNAGAGCKYFLGVFGVDALAKLAAVTFDSSGHISVACVCYGLVPSIHVAEMECCQGEEGIHEVWRIVGQPYYPIEPGGSDCVCGLVNSIPESV
jgi:hypothetical protein